MVVLGAGGFTTGGLNFDAKIRRNSTDLEDLFIAHIGGMDAFALGLETAYAVLSDSRLPAMKKQRYSSFDSGPGADFEKGRLGFEELADLAEKIGEPEVSSGKQELYENILNRYLFAKGR